jgi:NAD(P)-dependent dehydrogenase (short-subunit alcohol dehydrogenase family)
MTSKVIIITGASRGIGLAVAQFLLRHRHKVVLASRSKDQLESLKQQYPEQVEYVTGDLADFSVCAWASRHAPTVVNRAVDSTKSHRRGSGQIWQN